MLPTRIRYTVYNPFLSRIIFRNSVGLIMEKMNARHHLYETLNETAYLMQSPKNAKRLMYAIEELTEGRGKERELIE